MSEPEPISQGEEDGEVEGGGKPEQVSEPLETAVDDGSTEQVGHSRHDRHSINTEVSNFDDICIQCHVFRVRNWSH